LTTAIAIVGRSKTGKTTLIEKLIVELNARGYKVATIKHTLHKVEFDIPGSDTWRHINAGSSAVVLSSDDSIMMLKRKKENLSVEDTIKMLGDEYDIILVEGFKNSNLPKIEVHRKINGISLENLTNVVAIATDDEIKDEYNHISLSDINGIVKLIEKLADKNNTA
jgi:molybdopterin-guanine dinucleotide biosynthesis protein B